MVANTWPLLTFLPGKSSKVDLTYPAIGRETEAMDTGGTSTNPAHLTSSPISCWIISPRLIPAFCFCSAVNLISCAAVEAGLFMDSFFFESHEANMMSPHTIIFICLFIA